VLDQPGDDERPVKLQGHGLGQAALVQLELGADDDDRAPRLVHALAQQIAAEAPLFALEHIRERF
jgi:hypothetical protein